MESEQIKKQSAIESQLLDRIMFLLVKKEPLDLAGMKSKLMIILSDYNIGPKETALAVCTQGKNEILLQRFLLAKATAGCTERTLKQYQAEIARTLRRIDKDADQITSVDIQVYLARLLAAGNSKSYCDTVRRYLSSFYAFLSREEIIKSNPMNRVDNIKFRREKEPAFTDMEIERMRAACRSAFERSVFEMLLSTGCRAAELCSIKISDIKDSQITVLGKGEKYRTVYINAKASIALESYLAERGDKNPYLFPAGLPLSSPEGLKISRVKGSWYKYPELVDPLKSYMRESINTLMKKVGERAGVSGVHAHRFRRTCATLALRRGMPIEIVSMMLGHEQVSTTQIYLDIREDDLKEAHKKYVI